MKIYPELNSAMRTGRRMLTHIDTDTRPQLFDVKLLIIAMALLIVCVCSIAFGAEVIPEDRAINAIIGEAENQGYEGMLAVACAIRNRGTLHGVYGEHAPRVRARKYTKAIWLQAREVWRKSAYSTGFNPSMGANSWENITEFGKPYWADKCEQTAIVRDHVFYKCKWVK